MLVNEINNLVRVHAKLTKQNSDFRNHNVFCIARDGRRIEFCSHEEVRGMLCLFLEKFIKMLEQSQSKKDLAKALAYFWLGFISIHPFADANGRTAKLYMQEKAKSAGYHFTHFSKLDALLLEGEAHSDLKNLIPLFFSALKETA